MSFIYTIYDVALFYIFISFICIMTWFFCIVLQLFKFEVQSLDNLMIRFFQI